MRRRARAPPGSARRRRDRRRRAPSVAPPPPPPRPPYRRAPAPQGRCPACRRRGSGPCRSRAPGTPCVSRYSKVSGRSRMLFAPGADDADGRARQFGQVRRDVHRRRRAAMDAADAARREDADARLLRAEHRARHRRRAEAAAGERRGEIAAADLHRLPILREPLDLRAVQPDDDPPIDQPDRRGHRPRRAHRLLHFPRQVAGCPDRESRAR